MKLLSSIPASLAVFPVVAILYGLQVFPLTGVVLMLTGAPLWTGMLVNLGMLGILLEIPARFFASRMPLASFLWLVIPLAYFGWYGTQAYNDHKALDSLQEQYDAQNAGVFVPFDAEKHSLVLAGSTSNYAGELTEKFGIPEVFVESEGGAEGYLSTRLIDKDLCSDVRRDPLLRAAFIHTYGVLDGDRIGRRRRASEFCSLRMPRKPHKAITTIAITENKTSIDGLPVTLTNTLIRMADGSEFVLRGGRAEPYPWFPVPILGCAINSSPSWVCFRGFSRDRSRPIVSSPKRYGSDLLVLARALGLEPIEPRDRRAVRRETVDEQLKQAVQLQLALDISDLRDAVADPSERMTVHSIRVLQESPDALLPLAPLIVEGIVRAAAISENPYRNRETGKNLALLFGKLPEEVQNKYSDEMSLIYKRADEANDGRHWLYHAGPLLRFRQPTI